MHRFNTEPIFFNLIHYFNVFKIVFQINKYVSTVHFIAKLLILLVL